MTAAMRKALARFLARQDSSHRPRGHWIIAVAAGGVVFFVLLPLLFVLVGRALPRLVPLALPRALELAVGGCASLLGLSIGGWAVATFWGVGRGTPVPLVPPQNLVVTGPFAYCRNPIQLGAIVFYLGVGCLFLSLPAGVVMFVLGMLIGTAYHRFVEEPSLVLRFGAPYEEYRRRTPFLFPRIFRRRHSE